MVNFPDIPERRYLSSGRQNPPPHSHRWLQQRSQSRTSSLKVGTEEVSAENGRISCQSKLTHLPKFKSAGFEPNTATTSNSG